MRLRRSICALVLLVLTLSCSLTVYAEGEVGSDFLNAISAPNWVEMGLVYTLEDGTEAIGYFEDVGKAYLGECSLTPLPAEFDKDGDGAVRINDVYEILHSPVDMTATVYAEVLSNVTEGYNGEQFRQAFYKVIKEHTNCNGLDELITIPFDVFLREYSFILSSYCLIHGDSFMSVSSNWFESFFIAWSGDSTMGVYGGMFDPAFNNFCNYLDMASDFVLSDEQLDFNWDEHLDDPNGTDFQSPGSSEEDALNIESSDAKEDWLNDNIDIPYTDEGVELPDGSDLKDSDKRQISEWIEQINGKSSDKWFITMRVIRIIVGMVLIIYSVLLYVSYWIDRMNNFIDISLLSLLTLGKFAVSDDDAVSTYKGDTRGVKLVVHRDIIRICCIGFIIGMLILTGVLFQLILRPVLWVRSL